MVTSINPHFLVMIFTSQAVSWNIFNFYASNARNSRLAVWDEETKVAETMRQEIIFCMGYFNTPLYPSKKLGGLDLTF